MPFCPRFNWKASSGLWDLRWVAGVAGVILKQDRILTLRGKWTLRHFTPRETWWFTSCSNSGAEGKAAFVVSTLALLLPSRFGSALKCVFSSTDVTERPEMWKVWKWRKEYPFCRRRQGWKIVFDIYVLCLVGDFHEILCPSHIPK